MIKPSLSTDFVRYWTPAVAALLSICFGMGLMGIFGFFINPVAEEFDVAVKVITTAPVFLIIVPAFTGPLVGKFIDTFPVRWLMFFGVTIAMVGLLSISRASTIQQAGLGFLGFAIGLASSGPIAINSLMTKLYGHRAGKALALAAIGVSFSSALMPLWVANLLENGSWRDALQTIAISIYVIMLFVVFFLYPRTNSPLAPRKSTVLASRATESNVFNNVTGSQTSGVVSENKKNHDVIPADHDEPLAAVAFYKDPAFWFIGFGVALAMNAALVFGICFPAHLLDVGFDLRHAALISSMGGVGGLLGKLMIAFIIDRYRQQVKYPAAAVLIVQSIGIAGIIVGGSGNAAYIAALCLGFGGGAFVPMHPILNSYYFDKEVIGRVNGAQMPLFLPFGLVGAPLAGHVYDQTGSYQPVLLALVVALVSAACLLMFLSKPGERPSEWVPAVDSSK